MGFYGVWNPMKKERRRGELRFIFSFSFHKTNINNLLTLHSLIEEDGDDYPI
jgi:hypothetical protein